MDLHLQAVLTSVVASHREALGKMNGFLELAVAEGMSRWNDLYPHAVDLDGNTLGSTVRELLWTMATPGMTKASLLVVPTPNRSARLISADGLSIRVRKRGTSSKTGAYLRERVLEDIALFGDSWGFGGDVELVILWEPNYLDEDLKSVTLAAVGDLDVRGSTVIYAEIPLPSPAAIIVNPAPVVDPLPEDDFEDFLAQEDSRGGEPPVGA